MLRGFLIPDIPKEAKATFRFDFPSQALRGVVMVALMPFGIWGLVARFSVGASPFQIACMANALAVGLIVSLVLAQCSRGRRKLPFVVIPRLLASAALLGVVFVDSPLWFTVLISAALALDSMAASNVTAIYEAGYPVTHRGRIVSFTRVYQHVLRLGAALLFREIVRETPDAYQAMFLGIGACALVSAVLFSRIREAPPILDVNMLSAPTKVLDIFRRNRPFARYMAFFFVFGFANLMTIPVLPFHVQKLIEGAGKTGAASGAGLGQAILIYTVIPAAGAIIAVRFWGRLFDDIGIITLRAILNLFFIGAAVIWLLASSVTPLYVAGALWGIGQGGTQLVWLLSVIAFAPRDEVPMYMGAHTLLTGVRMIIAPQVGQYLFTLTRADYGATFVLGVAVVLMVLATIGVYFLTGKPLNEVGGDRCANRLS